MYREVMCVCLVGLLLFDFPEVAAKPLRRSRDLPASDSLILNSIIPRSRQRRHADQHDTLDESLTALEGVGSLSEPSEVLRRERRTAMFMLAATLANCSRCKRVNIRQRDFELQVRLADS